MNWKPNDKVIYTHKVNGRQFKHEARIIKPLSKLVFLIEIDGSTRSAHVNQLKYIPQTPFVLKNNFSNPSLSGDITDNQSYSSNSDEDTSEEKDAVQTSEFKQNSSHVIRRSNRTRNPRHSNLNLEKLAKKTT